MSELWLVGNWQGEKNRIKKESKSVHIEYADSAIGIKGIQSEKINL